MYKTIFLKRARYFTILLSLAILLLQGVSVQATTPSRAFAKISRSVMPYGDGKTSQLQAWKLKLLVKASTTALWIQKKFAPHREQGEKTNGLAIASLACGIVGLTLLPIIPSLVALILGIVALNQIDKRGEQGQGLAIAGIVTGGIGVLAGILLVLMLIALAV